MAEDLQVTDTLLVDLLRCCDKDAILKLFHYENVVKENYFKNILAYHIIVESLVTSPYLEKVVTKLVFLLTLHGADINKQDKNGDTALLIYVREVYELSDDVLQAFLRCGSDVILKNKLGQGVLESVLHSDHFPRQIKARLLEYMPGIWRAVEADDAMTVRRLINQWCSIHVEKDDLTVLQLAFNKGTENIIRVISGIGSTMDLIHAVLAGDRVSVKSILETNVKYNINLKNMGDRGTTPLFYAMCDNDKPMVDLLLKNGARLDIGIQGEKEQELPLYFAALSHSPSIHVDILQHTIPTAPVAVDQIYYKGQNVIFYCINTNIEIELFEEILSKCSSHVLTQHIQVFKSSMDAKHYAQKLEKDDFVAVIDKVVKKWCAKNGCHNKRNVLALHGFQFTSYMSSNATNNEDFLQILPEYEGYKSKLKRAVEDGDLITVKEMLYSESWSKKGLHPYFPDSRVCNDGQPLLHKAVLRQHVDIVREIAECLVFKCNTKLDSVKDQFYRTVYHYAHGMEEGKELVFLLEDLGMSEFAMDKELQEKCFEKYAYNKVIGLEAVIDGRSPIAFKDRKGQKEMKELLLYQLHQDFRQTEPDPWSVPLPLPIIGYLRKCLHEHQHAKMDHPLANNSMGKVKSLPDSDHMYAKINPQDFYQTKTLFSNGHKIDDKYQKNGAKENQTDHYQILETNNRIKFTDVGTSKDDQHEEEQDYFENKKIEKICKPAVDDDNEVSEVESSEESFDRVSSQKPLLNSDEGSDCSDTDNECYELDHDIHEQDEDYDGDYSDLESEDERDKDRLTNYCIIL